MKTLSIAVACALLAWLSPAHAAERLLTASEATAEIHAAVRFLKERHPDPFWHTSQDRFEFTLRQITRSEDAVSLPRHYFNLSKLYALILDTHTQLYPGAERPIIERTFPIRVRLFSEGLYVVGAGDPYRGLVGKRIVSIGGSPTDTVIDQLAEYAFAENHHRKRVFTEIYFYWPETYEILGLTDRDSGVSLIVEDDAGRSERVRLVQANSASFVEHFRRSRTATGTDPLPAGWTGLAEVHDFDVPLYLRNLDRNYSYTYLPDSKAMYVQINRPTNQAGAQTALDFNLEWFARLRQSRVERFILDLRNNPGGWINVTAPIPALLSAHRVNDEHKQLDLYIVLIGTDSVSAAATAAAAMEAELSRTITIGQPTGSRPYLFLNAEKMTLPHSGIELEVSTASMPTLDGDERMFIAPDIWIDYSYREYIAGKDSVLEAALRVTGAQVDELHEGRAPLRGWQRKSQDVARARPR